MNNHQHIEPTKHVFWFWDTQHFGDGIQVDLDGIYGFEILEYCYMQI